MYLAAYCPSNYRRREPAPIIFFKEGDEEGVLYQHDDALMVTMLVTNFTTRRIFIANDSSANSLFWEVFTQMGINIA